MNNEKSSTSFVPMLLVRCRRYLLWIPLALGLVIAFFAPTDVLNVRWMNAFVGFVANLIPMVNRLSQPFELAQVTQLYYSLMWISLPIIYYSIDVGDRSTLIIRLKANRALFWWLITFFSFIWFGLLYMFSYASPNPFNRDTLSACMLHSRPCMATFGGIFIVSLAALPKLVIQTINCYSDIYSKGDEI